MDLMCKLWKQFSGDINVTTDKVRWSKECVALQFGFRPIVTNHRWNDVGWQTYWWKQIRLMYSAWFYSTIAGNCKHQKIILSESENDSKSVNTRHQLQKSNRASWWNEIGADGWNSPIQWNGIHMNLVATSNDMKLYILKQRMNWRRWW